MLLPEEPHEIMSIQASHWVDLRRHLRGLELLTCSVGPSGDLYILAERPSSHKKRFHLPQLLTAKVRDFIVLRIDGASVQRFEIHDRTEHFSYIQPLPDNELLLVSARSWYRGPEDFDLNGKIFSEGGELKREFLLGDGIKDVQTTSDGRIWTSYFDEGVYGNLGWGMPGNHDYVAPIGRTGLILWNQTGNKLYEFSEDLPPIDDCYALNVATDNETWCYYYSAFPLVRIKNLNDHTLWFPQIQGSGGFLVWQNHILFLGGWNYRESFPLFELEINETAVFRGGYQIQTEQGKSLKPALSTWRGCMLYYLLKNKVCLRVDLRQFPGIGA